jgi:hypothetical protein
VGLHIEEVGPGDVFDALDVLAILSGKEGVQILKAPGVFPDLLLVTEVGEHGEIEQNPDRGEAGEDGDDDNDGLRGIQKNGKVEIHNVVMIARE